MDATYARAYRRLYEEHWWWRAREAMLLSTIEALRPDRRWGEILDVGCGDALFFDALSRYGRVRGVEPVGEIVSAANRERVHVGPFDEGFRPGCRFGLVLMLDVLEHLSDPEAALGRARTLLEPDGRIVITVPAFRALWTSHDDLNEHVTRYTRRTLGAVATRAGVRFDRLGYFFHWLVVPKLGVRAAEAVVGARPAPARVPAPAVNRLLQGVCRLEQRTWGRLGLPFGSSLLAVGRAA